MIPPNVRIILLANNFMESGENEGLWYHKDKYENKPIIAFIDFRKVPAGIRYAKVDGGGFLPKGSEDIIPCLVKVKAQMQELQKTGKLPAEVEEYLKFQTGQDAKKGIQKVDTPQQTNPSEKKPDQPMQDNGIWITVNVDGVWKDYRFTQAEYEQARTEALVENLKALSRCCEIVNKERAAGRLVELTNDQIVTLLFSTIAQPAHYYFERKCRTLILDERQK